MNKTLLILGIVASCFACSNFRVLNLWKRQEDGIFIKDCMYDYEINNDTEDCKIIYSLNLLKECFQPTHYHFNLYSPILKHYIKKPSYSCYYYDFYKLTNEKKFKEILGIEENHNIIEIEKIVTNPDGYLPNLCLYNTNPIFQATRILSSGNIPVKSIKIAHFSERVQTALHNIKSIYLITQEHKRYEFKTPCTYDNKLAIMTMLTYKLLTPDKIKNYLTLGKPNSIILIFEHISTKRASNRKIAEKVEMKTERVIEAQHNMIEAQYSMIEATVKKALKTTNNEDSFCEQVILGLKNPDSVDNASGPLKSFINDLSKEDLAYFKMVLHLYYVTENPKSNTQKLDIKEGNVDSIKKGLSCFPCCL